MVWQVDVVVMQLDAVFIAPATAFPRPIAATTIAAPTIARISAYSAAAAPESSRMIFRKFFIAQPHALSPTAGRTTVLATWLEMRVCLVRKINCRTRSIVCATSLGMDGLRLS